MSTLASQTISVASAGMFQLDGQDNPQSSDAARITVESAVGIRWFADPDAATSVVSAASGHVALNGAEITLLGHEVTDFACRAMPGGSAMLQVSYKR